MTSFSIKHLLVAGCLLAGAAPGVLAYAQVAAEPTACNVDAHGVALGGYDPVAYFPEAGNTPQQGKQELAIPYGGATYYFADQDNFDRFLRDPEKYVPAHRGYCAFGTSIGETFEVDPESFLVEDGRLYVFLRNDKVDARALWIESDGEARDNASKQSGEAERHAGDDRTTYRAVAGGVGAAGYDLVAYFPEGGSAPRRGLSRHTTEFGGVTYRFASARNRSLFLQDPMRYLPRFGGWCAFGVSVDAELAIDPASFVVMDDQLYLFFQNEDTDARALFLADPDMACSIAEDKWHAQHAE